MPCYGPITGYYSKVVGASGKRGITFQRSAAFSGVPIKLPCGRCIGCRLDRSLQWAIRCMHEKQLYDRSAFVSLTYADEFLPEGGTLVKRDGQLFMKRLRKVTGPGLRFYMCGEYGGTFKRPHFHYLFFNYDFDDRKFFKVTKRGDKLYTSKVLSALWPFGHSLIGEVTLESCAYVARYICDKVTGDKADEHYTSVDSCGVVTSRLPEFTDMSRRPGLGSLWYEKYGKHSHLSGDFAVMAGKRVRMPRFYDDRFELVDGKALARLKSRRRRKAILRKRDDSSRRRRVRELCMLARLKQNRKDEL